MLNERSYKNLEGVDESLVRVMKRASEISDVPFIVIEGMRTLERQKQLFEKGATRTMNSKHLVGKAVDVVPTLDGVIRWDWPLYHKLAKWIKQAALDEGVNLQWGGDWRTFKDGPHWELK